MTAHETIITNPDGSQTIIRTPRYVHETPVVGPSSTMKAPEPNEAVDAAYAERWEMTKVLLVLLRLSEKITTRVTMQREPGHDWPLLYIELRAARHMFMDGPYLQVSWHQTDAQLNELHKLNLGIMDRDIRTCGYDHPFRVIWNGRTSGKYSDLLKFVRKYA